MRYGLYGFGALLMILLQTTLLPRWPLFDRCFDLLVPLIVYLGLYRPLREGLPAVILLGFVQDAITGGAFGLYLTGYFWIFLSVVWVITFLRVTNTLLILLVVPASVALQNLIFFGTVALAGVHGQMPVQALRTTTVQLGWALVIGPLFLTVMDRLQGSLERWSADRAAEREA